MKTFSSFRFLTLPLGLITLVTLVTLAIATLLASAEMRTFTNAEGKSLEAEVVGVSSGKVTLKLKTGKTYTLPFQKLSEADQTYIKEWYEKNKNNAKPSDFRLDLVRKKERIRVPRDKSDKAGKGSPSKMSIQEVSYEFTLSQRASTPTENIKVHSLIIKRTTTRGDDAEDPAYKEIVDVKEIDTLTSKKPEEWATDPESCENVSKKSKASSSSSKEDIIGIVVTVSVGGKELFKKYDPSTFERDLAKIQEKNPEIGTEQEAKAKPAAKKKPKKKKKAPKKKKAEEDKKEAK